MPGGPGDLAIDQQDLVLRLGPAHSGERESVPDFHTLDGLDSHESGRESGVQSPVGMHVRSQPRRKTFRDDFHHPAEGVSVGLGGVDLRDHRLTDRGYRAPHRVRVNGGQVGGGRRRGVAGHRADPDDVAEDLHSGRLVQ